MKEELDWEDDVFDYQDPDDVGDIKANELVVYSRDWTIATFYDQIEQGNIDLNPGFQRRNAWDDSKRSKLIESIIKGYPVPEIVLAEDTKNRGSFIVIDGKQRLLTLAGFINNEKYKYWTNPIVKDLKIESQERNYTYCEIISNPALKRAFENASLRCTVITNYSTDDVLYDIFYRLNSGSSPLSSQELRQALNKGPYSEYLISVTNIDNNLRKVMNLKTPDRRLRDIEVVLRVMSFLRYAGDYHGNLRVYLDNMMKRFNHEYNNTPDTIIELYNLIVNTIDTLKDVYGEYLRIGRRIKNGEYENRFNRVILEVQIFYFCKIPRTCLTSENNKKFLELFVDICEKDMDFKTSIEQSTKNMENYIVRYTKFQDIVNQAYNCNLNINPFRNAHV